MQEIKNNPQVYTTQEGMQEIKNNPQLQEIKTNPQAYTTQENIEQIRNNPKVYTRDKKKPSGIHYPRGYRRD